MKTLIVNLQAIARPLSGKPTPQHARDLKVVPGTIACLERWKAWEYNIWIYANSPIAIAGYWNTEALMRYALYCFPLAEAIFWSSGGEPENEIFRTTVSGSAELKTSNTSHPTPLGLAIERAVSGRDAGCVWAIGCTPEDEELAASAGVNFLDADIWLEVLDPADIDPPEQIPNEYLTTLRVGDKLN